MATDYLGLLFRYLPVAVDVIGRGTGLISEGDADKVKRGLALVQQGYALVQDISDSGSKAGGPTQADLDRIASKYEISDERLESLLTGGPG